MARNAGAPSTGKIKLSTAETATAAVRDSAASPVAIVGPGVVSGFYAVLTTGFSATLRDTDANGQVLLRIAGADGTVQRESATPEHWKGFALGGLHVTIAGTGSLEVEYQIDT